MKKMMHSTFLTFSLMILLLLFAACSSTTDNDYDQAKIAKEVIEGNTQFAFDIFRDLDRGEGEGNIFISPLSISTALTMTYQGAGSTTKAAMADTLGFTGIEDEKLNESYQNLIRYLKQLDSQVELNIDNSLWIREGKKIKKNFITTNQKIFDAPVTTLDFSQETAADKINQWVSDATKQKIDRMIEPPIPNPKNIAMYLINAIYFKGGWTSPFDQELTYPAKFKAGNGSTSEVMMMRKTGEVEYGSGDDFKAIRLPYGKGQAAMYCILPQKGDSINDFIASLDKEKWYEIKHSIQEEDDLVLRLPRFKIEYGIKDLNDHLMNLGMAEAFLESADFLGIKDDNRPLFISQVLHKGVIEVNEEGSEAAAATVVEMEDADIAEPLNFIADRPFVFIIADDQTETILFMGKMYDPK